MERTGIAVNAPVFAATIWVDAGFEPDIRAVVPRDNGAGAVLEKLGSRKRFLFRVPIGIPLQGKSLEPVGRVANRPTGTGRSCGVFHAPAYAINLKFKKRKGLRAEKPPGKSLGKYIRLITARLEVGEQRYSRLVMAAVSSHP